MLVLDQERLERNARGTAQEAYAQQVNDWTMQQLGDARVVESTRLRESNPERQAGRLYQNPARLEEELRKANPNFYFEHLAPFGNATKKRLFYVKPDGTKDFICLYESGVTPEWSTMVSWYTWVPDPSYQLGDRELDRSEVKAAPVTLQEAADLIKKHGPAGAKTELLKRRADNYDPDVRPGFIKKLVIGREAIRGWRSVLVRPLQQGYITLNQAKAIVTALGGGSDRANWTRATGNRSVAATI